jgi:hypothetical protein
VATAFESSRTERGRRTAIGSFLGCLSFYKARSSNPSRPSKISDISSPPRYAHGAVSLRFQFERDVVDHVEPERQGAPLKNDLAIRSWPMDRFMIATHLTVGRPPRLSGLPTGLLRSSPA